RTLKRRKGCKRELERSLQRARLVRHNLAVGMGGARLLGGVLAATFGVAAACGEAVAPVPASPTLKFCPTVALPTWFAYQNEGQPWVQLPAGTASFSFEPARRLTIAYATANPSGAGGGATVWIAS